MPDQLSPQERRAAGALEAARSFLTYTAESIGPNIGNHLRTAIKAIDVAAEQLGTTVSIDLVRSFLLEAAELCPNVAHHLLAAIRELDQAADKLARVEPLPGCVGLVLGELCGEPSDMYCPICRKAFCYACARGHRCAA